MADKKPQPKQKAAKDSRGKSAQRGHKQAAARPQAKPPFRKQRVAPQPGDACVQDSQRLLLAVSRLQSLFIDEAKPETLFGLLLEELLKLTDSAYGFIGEVLRTAEGQPYLRAHAITDIAWNEETKALLAAHAPTLEFRNLKTLFGHVMTTGKPVIANDPANDPRAGGLPPGHPPMHAFLGLPFSRGKLLTGMVGVANRPGGYDEALVAYLEPFLSTCAQLLEGYRNRRLRAEAEAALRQSEERWQLAVRGSQDAIWDWDIQKGTVFYSARWKAMRGFDEEELTDSVDEWRTRIHPEDRDRVLQAVGAYLSKRSMEFRQEYRIQRKDGSYGWVLDRGIACWDEQGLAVRMTGSESDITERKLAEQALLEANTAVELAMEGISRLDESGRYVYVNHHYAVLLGYRPEELIGQSWEITVHPDDRASALTTFAEMVATGKAEADLRGVKKDGRVIWKHVVVAKPDGGKGRIPGHFCFARDVTERKREEALQEAEKQALELVAKGTALSDVLALICRTIETHTAPMLCSIMLVTDDGAHLSLAAGPSLPDDYNQAVATIPIGPTVGSCGSAAHFKTPSIVTDIATDPLWKDYASVTLAQGLKACWSQPIFNSTGTLLGTFAAYYREIRCPHPADLKIVEQASHIAALAIEHARMTEALRESEARFQAFMNYSPVVSFIKDEVGRHLYVNPSFERCFQVSFDQIRGKTNDELMPAPVAAKLNENDRRVLSTGEATELEETVPTPDGQSKHWLVLKFPLKGMAGELLLGGVAIDITARKEMEFALAQQEEHLRLFIEHSPVSLAMFDREMRYLAVSRRWRAEYRLGDQPLIGRSHYEVFPEIPERWRAIHRRCLTGAIERREEDPFVRADGRTDWSRWEIHPWRTGAGDVGGIVLFSEDITARKQAEDALRESEARFRVIADTVPALIWMAGPDTHCSYFNTRWLEYTGRTMEQEQGNGWVEGVHPEDVDRCLKTYLGAFDRRESFDMEYRLRKADGRYGWIHDSGVPRFLPDGTFAGYLGVCIDVTDRKQAEEQSRQSEAFVTSMVEHLPHMVFVKEAQGLRFVRLNKAAEQLLGTTRDTLLGKTDYDVFPRSDADFFTKKDREVLATGGLVDIEEEILQTARGPRILHTKKVPIYGEDGTPQYLLGISEDITDRKKAEENLLRTQFAMDQAVDAVYWIDPQARILYTNEAASAMLGYTADEFQQMTVHDLNPDFPPARWPGWWEETRAKKVISLETAHVTKDGRRIPIDIRVSFLAYGGQEFHCAFVRDISERKRSDQALRESQERFELATRATNDGIWDWNILTGAQYWSDRHLELFGLGPGEVSPTYERWISLVHPDDADRVHQATCRHLETREPYDVEVRVRMKDGRYRWFRDRGQALWDLTGRPVRMVGSISDVTERRMAEEALRTAHMELERRVEERTAQLALANRSLLDEIAERKRVENRLRTTQYAVDHAADQIFVIGPNGYFLDVNESACRRLGYTKEELQAMSVMDIDPDCPVEAWNKAWKELTAVRKMRLEGRHLSKTGEIYPVEVVANYLEHDGQELDYAIVRDITDRKRAEEAIRESELRYKLLTEATFDGIAIHDQGILLEVNAGLERMFGYQPGELVGRSMWELIAEESHDLVWANMKHNVNGPYEAIGRRKDGTTFPGEVVVRPYRYRGKDVRLVAGRDITERKHLEVERFRHTEELERQVVERTAEIAKLESQRAQTERLAALGRLAAGVAHEINNPIAGIKNAFTLVKQAVDPAHPQYEFVAMVDREIDRVSSIVQNMYQLYRRESGKMEMVDLRAMIGDIVALFSKQLQQRQLQLVVDVDPGLNRLNVPRSDLLQVLLNLLNNAIDCSQEQTVIQLRIHEEEDVIRIAVADQGAGIAPEVFPQIFDPFFTTKTEGDQKGMGLGLSISQSLVMAMGGKIDVQTQVGQGSTFSVLIPRHKPIASMPDHLPTLKEVVPHDC